MKELIRYFRILAIATVTGILLLPLVALASDITNALYHGTVQALNSGAATAQYVAANFTLSTPDLITAGHLNASANNAVMRDDADSDIAFMPGYGSNPWIVWYDNIMTGTSKNTYLYTGDVSGGGIRWFPGTTGMTVTDNTSLEWGASGNWTGAGYFNPLSTGYFFNKAGAVFAQGNGDGTANISVYTSANGSPIRPNAAGDNTSLTPSAGTNWGCVSDVNDATYVSGTTGAYQLDLYNIPNHTTETAPIIAVTTYMRVRGSNAVSCWWETAIKTGTTVSYGVEWFITSMVYTDYFTTYTTNPSTGVSWTWSDIDALQIGVAGKAGVADAWCSEVWCAVTYSAVGTSVNTGAISAGYHTYMAYLAGGFLGFKVDSSAAATVVYADNITNNSENWQFVTDDILLYVKFIEIQQSGVEKGYWEWEYAATFSDQSGNGNTGTPSIRTTSSDSDVTASLISYLPLEQAVADSSIINEWPEMIAAAPDQPATMYTENNTPGIFFAPLITTLMNAAGLPTSLFWYNFAFATVLIAGIGTFYFMAAKSQNGLLLKCIVMSTVMLFWSLPGPNVYGMYVVIYFIMWCFGAIVLSRNYGW